MNAEVQVTGGPVAGVTAAGTGVTGFRGISYAAAPLAELRWKPPAPVTAWSEPRKAEKIASDCMHPGPAAALGSEDCLYLNVWTASKGPGEGFPVAVFLADTEGASGMDGEALALQSVVVVTANSRTGLMGFLAHPDLTGESDKKASGNYGLLDQIAVLEWVKRNAAAFGGDAKRVTVVGTTVPWLLGSPLAMGLFARAITTGGSAYTGDLADAERAGDTFAQAENAHSMRFLRPMEAGDVVQAAVDERYNPGPVVDGWVLPADWQKAAPVNIPRMAVSGEFNLSKPESGWVNFVKTGER